MYSWRALNTTFINIYIGKYKLGKKFLRKISSLEDKYSKILAYLGEYPMIVIDVEKQNNTEVNS